MGHSCEGRLLSSHALPSESLWVTGRQIVRRTTVSASGSYRARPVTASVRSAPLEVFVDLTGDVTLEDTDDLGFGSPFSEPSRDVFAGAFVAAHAGEHDPPQRMVGLTVPAPVESTPDGLARRCCDGCDTAQV